MKKMENTLVSKMSDMCLQSVSDKRAVRSFHPGEHIASIGPSVKVVYWHSDDLSQGYKIPRSCRVKLKLVPAKWKSDVIARFLQGRKVETLNISGVYIDSFDFLHTYCGLEEFHAVGVQLGPVDDSERGLGFYFDSPWIGDGFSRLSGAKFSDIRVLDLSDTRIHDIRSFMKSLPPMNKLRSLRLYGANDMHVGDLSRFPRIRELCISLTRGGLTLTWDVDVNNFPLTVDIGPCNLIVGGDGRIDVCSSLESLVMLRHGGALNGLWSMIDKLDLIGNDGTVYNDHKHVESVLGLGDEFDYKGGFINLMSFRRRNIY